MGKLRTGYIFTGKHGWICIAAKEGVAEDWAAYIAIVSLSESQANFVDQTLKYGEKIPQAWAEAIFPEFAKEFAYRP